MCPALWPCTTPMVTSVFVVYTDVGLSSPSRKDWGFRQEQQSASTCQALGCGSPVYRWQPCSSSRSNPGRPTGDPMMWDSKGLATLSHLGTSPMAICCGCGCSTSWLTSPSPFLFPPAQGDSETHTTHRHSCLSSLQVGTPGLTGAGGDPGLQL